MSDKEAGKRIIHSAYEAKAIVAGLERYSALPDDYPGDAVQEAIIAAIAAARPHIMEEAARIAIGNMPDGPTGQETPYGQGRIDAAAAIRAAKEKGDA